MISKAKFPLYAKCALPNLAAEILNHNGGHPQTYAQWANITEDVLHSYIQGVGDITLNEFFSMVRLLRSLTAVPCSTEYLTCKNLSYYDLSKPKHYRKVVAAYHALEKARAICPDEGFRKASKNVKPLKEVIRCGLISRARVNRILRLTENMEIARQIKENDPKPRAAVIDIDKAAAGQRHL